MEIIKKKILLENSIDRNNNSPTWGTITASTFYINVFLTQNINNIGLFTDIEYTSSITATTFTGLSSTDLLTLRFQNKKESDYYSNIHLPITGSTDSKKEDLISYDQNNPYIVGFDMETENYVNYKGVAISGVSRITDNGEPSIYVFDANSDSNIGTNNQTSGILYKDYSGLTRTTFINGEPIDLQLTEFRYISEGYNMTNLSLSALTKEEYLFGVVSPPVVKNDVFIDRGVTSVMDMHLRLSEIKNLGELTRYNNGFYKITKI